MLWEIFVLMNKWRRQKCFPEGKLEGLKIKSKAVSTLWLGVFIIWVGGGLCG